MSELYFAIRDYGVPAILFMWLALVAAIFIPTKYRLTRIFHRAPSERTSDILNPPVQTIPEREER